MVQELSFLPVVVPWSACQPQPDNCLQARLNFCHPGNCFELFVAEAGSKIPGFAPRILSSIGSMMTGVWRMLILESPGFLGQFGGLRPLAVYYKGGSWR